MISARKRAGAVVAVSVVLLVSCRSQNESLPTNSQSPDTVVSSTPPFQTKEPERYRAVRTITVVSPEGQTLVTKTSVARDGESRRHESTVASKAIVYLDVPEGKFVLLPAEMVYADLTDESTISADPNEDGLESSPDALLHTDAGNTSYQKMGNEVIAGHNTNKYRIVVNSPAPANVSQSETLMWIDEALQMPIRSETKSGDGTRVTMEVSEIKLEVEKRLFTIPEGYKKLNFTELRKRLTAPENNPSPDKGIH
jgi:outer membrane lipoprotein-sorting protein